MPLDLLHFGSGTQAAHYFFFCFIAILGTLQGVAQRYQIRGLFWVKGSAGYVLAGVLIAGAFAWFFLTDDEIFIPGLAGGELFVLFAVAFLLAVPSTRVVSWGVSRIPNATSAESQAEQNKEPTT